MPKDEGFGDEFADLNERFEERRDHDRDESREHRRRRSPKRSERRLGSDEDDFWTREGKKKEVSPLKFIENYVDAPEQHRRAANRSPEPGSLRTEIAKKQAWSQVVESDWADQHRDPTMDNRRAQAGLDAQSVNRRDFASGGQTYRDTDKPSVSNNKQGKSRDDGKSKRH